MTGEPHIQPTSSPMLPRLRSVRRPPALSTVGIHRVAVYFPRMAVAHAHLEVFDNVSSGKYTVGLGQSHMAYVTDREDVISMALTVLSTLVRESGISYRDIGRLDVGTETILDKSKSIKTSLMRLFADEGNLEVEGLDSTNACYGSTAALFNALAWIESSVWDGRYAAVVATDIAVYARGAARPTGGAGAVAMLLGPDAPICFEPRYRTTVMGDTYDFYKPSVDVEYPVVNGKETIDTFVKALDECYRRFCEKMEDDEGRRFDIMDGSVDYCVFHAPFYKMVKKSFARLVANDFIRSDINADNRFSSVEKYRHLEHSTSHHCREAVREFVDICADAFEEKCAPSAWLGREVGNCYTASLYTSLAAALTEVGDGLVGKRLMLFAFGSGFASSMFTLRVTASVKYVLVGKGLQQYLAERIIAPPEVYDSVMDSRERDYGRLGYTPQSEMSSLASGCYYLKEVTSDGQRRYAQVPHR